MLQLKQDRRYFWLFLVYAALVTPGAILFVAAQNLFWFALASHVCISYTAVCEVRSKVALNRWWMAKYPKGTWQYRALLAQHFFAAVLTLAVAAAAGFGFL
jgi:hypothetical protein